MRLFFYISKANGLGHLANILSSAKSKNFRRNISGVMSYNKGYYLQVFEGECEEVHSLAELIMKDGRHTDIQVIADIETESCYFSGWSMRLVPLLNSCVEFKSFMLDIEQNLEMLPPEKHSLTEIFYQHPRYTYTSEDSQKGRWGPQAFSVTEWPNFSRMQATPELLSLCGALLNNTMSYSELRSLEYYQSEHELKKTLKALQREKCLTVSKAKARSTLHSENQTNPNEYGFLYRVKDFISSHVSSR